MQDLLTELLWHNDAIDNAAVQLRQSMPGFLEAQRNYNSLAGQIRERAGHELYDEYFAQLMRYSGYEVFAYYSLGLGMRQEIAKTFEL